MPMRRLLETVAGWLLLIAAAGGCAASGHAAVGGPAPDFSETYLLHLPGIAGEKFIDHDMIDGLKDGGYDGPTEIYDWTAHDAGLDGLFARKRNRAEAQKVADKLESHFRADPN